MKVTDLRSLNTAHLSLSHSRLLGLVSHYYPQFTEVGWQQFSTYLL